MKAACHCSLFFTYGRNLVTPETEHSFSIGSETSGLLIQNLMCACVLYPFYMLCPSPLDYGTDFLWSCPRNLVTRLSTTVGPPCSRVVTYLQIQPITDGKHWGKNVTRAGDIAQQNGSCLNMHYGLGVKPNTTETGHGGT